MTNAQRIEERLRTDPGFRARFVCDAATALGDEGIELTMEAQRALAGAVKRATLPVRREQPRGMMWFTT
jgi:hypothetical protein